MPIATDHPVADDDDELPDPEVGLQLGHVPPQSKHLSRCLAAWRENEEEVGSLSSMIPPCGFLTLQVIDISMVDGVPTGQIVVHDGHCYLSAKVDSRYLVLLKKRSWGMYSLIQIRSTTGLHTDLVLVSLMVHV